ncbi:acyltransferase [uncultured Clostridium sp.]|uniref:acyltransferase n=1 Tax=uncultured Clostridium sp. TaxID=59620 RepID=UPI00258C30DB|nr:acyltransferase [uncultured Clostridium sp.]
MNSFYKKEELEKLGFESIGTNVKISKKVSIYSANNISIGDNVRIDDFCILSGKIKIGNYVHIAAYCGMFGGNEGIFLDDFSGLSSRTVVYAASDDYSGEFLTNPTVDDKYRNVISKPVKIGKHVVVGTGSTILPGVTIGEGSSVGACSLIAKDCDENAIYVGVPAKKLKERSKKIFELEKDFLSHK